jgi:hypothetical protein
LSRHNKDSVADGKPPRGEARKRGHKERLGGGQAPIRQRNGAEGGRVVLVCS